MMAPLQRVLLAEDDPDSAMVVKLSLEEFLSWQRLIDSHGLAGLRVTRLQDYRGQRARAG